MVEEERSIGRGCLMLFDLAASEEFMREQRMCDPFAFEFGRAPARRVVIEALIEPRQRPALPIGAIQNRARRRPRAASEIPVTWGA